MANRTVNDINPALNTLGLITYKLLIERPKDLSTLTAALRGIGMTVDSRSLIPNDIRLNFNSVYFVGLAEAFRMGIENEPDEAIKMRYDRRIVETLGNLAIDHTEDVVDYKNNCLSQALGSEERAAWLKKFFITKGIEGIE
jgi:hypothetical protein